MIKFLRKTVALYWAKCHVSNYAKILIDPIKNQEELLLHLLRKGSITEIGRKYGFPDIATVRDFQQKVPIHDYEEISLYIEKIKQGKENVLWPGKPIYFAKTSGTTSGTKYIPISKEGMPFHIQAARSAIFHYMVQKNTSDFVNGKMIFLQGSPKLEEIYGIKTGRLSGIIAHHIPDYLQRNKLPSWETNNIEDWKLKVDSIVRETEYENMTLISGIPPWLVMYFEKLVEKHNKTITQLFPNLQLIVTGGVNYNPYREVMSKLLGKSVDVIQTFPASEGFFAFQNDFHQEGMILLTNHGVFYEFIPLEEFGKPDAKILTIGDIELNKDYALIITTNSGLWRYNIGDVVRFVEKNPFKIVVSGRTKHFTSAFGEHVIAFEVEEAMKAIVARHNLYISEFHLAPQVAPLEGKPYHEWFIEFGELPLDLNAIAEDLDEEMKKKNVYYKELISGNVLKPLVITPLQKNAFQMYAKSEGKFGGQNKIPRLANNRKIGDFLTKYKL